MTPLEQAQEILQREPLPKDAEALIDALYDQASDDEKMLFPALYEALAQLTNE